MTSIPLSRGVSLAGFFRRTEWIFIGLIASVVIANLIVGYTNPQNVDWGSFALGAMGAVGLAILGGYYRVAYAHVAWLGKAAVTIAIAAIMGVMLGILFHLHMPRPEPVLTDALLAMDRWFGYDWPAAVAWVAEIPFLGTFLRWVYLSSFFQIIGLIVVLAYLKKNRELDAMTFTNGLSLMLVFVVWQAFPNLSQSTYLPIPYQTAEDAWLVTHSTYGAMLLDMAKNGLPIVSMDAMMGAVAFPSYHMVMCALTVVFARGTFLFWPYLITNIIMLPAILIHGAHHIADLFGGVAVMLMAMIPAYLIVNACYRRDARAA
ncbi:phosphatase PAP2 family protein [Yoonia sp. 2307UL14-13]|uniref:phosphatase PAP2 family protein n=1 Tax=Yoonia sp. 2307UL14-13 TaxID=3126506 RepID=UPI0030A56FBB